MLGPSEVIGGHLLKQWMNLFSGEGCRNPEGYNLSDTRQDKAHGRDIHAMAGPLVKASGWAGLSSHRTLLFGKGLCAVLTDLTYKHGNTLSFGNKPAHKNGP